MNENAREKLARLDQIRSEIQSLEAEIEEILLAGPDHFRKAPKKVRGGGHSRKKEASREAGV